MKKLIYAYILCLMPIQISAQSFVDLGLPSGTLWSSRNEVDFYFYDDAKVKYGEELPSKKQWEELMRCEWQWTGYGHVIIGPNGNSIFLPAAGSKECNNTMNNVCSNGEYLSIDKDYCLSFRGEMISYSKTYSCSSVSVRLVKRGKVEPTKIPPGFVDLGLSSGTLWKIESEEGFYSYEDAFRIYKDNLPSYWQFFELEKECNWIWEKGVYRLIGPNGKSMLMTTMGWRDWNGKIYGVGTYGYYWSSTFITWRLAEYFSFNQYSIIGMKEGERSNGYSVRLVY